MPFEYEVYKQQRVSLVSFHRAVTGPPQLNYPDIDDRGTSASATVSPEGRSSASPKARLSLSR